MPADKCIRILVPLLFGGGMFCGCLLPLLLFLSLFLSFAEKGIAFCYHRFGFNRNSGVKLSGLSVGERAEAMISVSHPDFRAELARYAEEHF